MSVFIVSYDLRKQGQDYSWLINRIKQYSGYAKLLESLWVVNVGTWWALEIANDLKQYIDSNDGLFVSKATRDSAWVKLLPGADEWLKNQL